VEFSKAVGHDHFGEEENKTAMDFKVMELDIMD
jgi:hypothetical protein